MDNTETNKQSILEYIPAADMEITTHSVSMQDQNSKILKANDQIQYKLNNLNEWIKATVLGRAGKVTGKNKNWYNVQETESEKQKC